MTENNNIISNYEDIEKKISKLLEINPIIKSVENRTNLKGEVIGKITKNYHYVEEDSYIKDIIDDLVKDEEITAIGVVNKDLKPIGTIIRQNLFDIVGKKFGRDLLENKKVKEICDKKSIGIVVKTPTFYYNVPILTVAKDLEKHLEDKSITYFTVIDNDGNFYGLFSNIDILFYLSKMTQKEIKLAKDIQLSIIKENTYIKEKDIEFAAATSMAKGLGGDFYTIKTVNNKHILTLCDVSGKGVSSALISVLLGGLIDFYDFENEKMSNFIKKLNEHIFDSFNLQKYLTGIFLEINEKNRIDIYDMGHSYIYVYMNKKLHKINNPHSNLPIGIAKDVETNSISLKLEKDKIFLIVSDGIIEQQNNEGRMYSLGRIREIIEKNENDISRIPEIILKDLENFRGKEPQHDDATLIIFRKV